MIKDFMPVLASLTGAFIALNGVFLSNRQNQKIRNEEFNKNIKLQKLEEISSTVDECLIWAEYQQRIMNMYRLRLELPDNKNSIEELMTKLKRLTIMYCSNLGSKTETFIQIIDTFHEKSTLFLIQNRPEITEEKVTFEMLSQHLNNVRNEHDCLMKVIREEIESILCMR